MNKSVEIIDNSFRVNECFQATSDMDYYIELDRQTTVNPFTGKGQLLGAPNFGKPIFVPMQDSFRNKVQTEVRHTRVFEGVHLERLIRRAKRFMNNQRAQLKNPPRHITYALMAFAKAEPDEFNARLNAS